MVARIMISRIVIILDILYEHAPFPPKFQASIRSFVIILPNAGAISTSAESLCFIGNNCFEAYSYVGLEKIRLI